MNSLKNENEFNNKNGVLNGLIKTSNHSRLFLTQIVRDRLLNRKDFRSIRKWCKKNHVPIYKDSCGEYVFKSEFDVVYNFPLIQRLMNQYSNDWENYYTYYLNNEAHKIIQLNKASDAVKTTRYIPKGSIAIKNKNV